MSVNNLDLEENGDDVDKKVKKEIKNKKVVVYILHRDSNKAERLLVEGTLAEEDKYYDGVVKLDDDGKFKYKQSKYEIPEECLNVDRKRSLFSSPRKQFTVIFNSGKTKPISYTAPKKWTASDLKVIRREQTTAEGIEGVISGGGVASSRGKLIIVFLIIFGVIAFVLFVLPRLVPALQNLPFM